MSNIQQVLTLDVCTKNREYMSIKPRGRLASLREYTTAMRGLGARFNSEDRTWDMPVRYLPELSDVCSKHVWAIHPTEALGERLNHISDLLDARQKEATKRWKVTNAILRPYQEEGAEFLAARTRAILADDMGLGKTLESLAALPSDVPVLVICPNLVKLNWVEEVKKFRPDLSPEAILGKKNFRWPKPGEVLVINYELVPEVHKSIKVPGHLHVILDEAQYVKNHKSQRTKKVRGIVRRASVVWALTGTPLESLPPDLWGVMQTLQVTREVFASWNEFVRLFNGTKLIFGGYDWTKDPLPEVSANLSRIMLRREKTAVLRDLPPKIRNEFHIDISKGRTSVWKDAEKEFESYGYENDEFDLSKMRFSEAIATARLELAVLKAKQCKPIIEEYKNANLPVVVFTAHRKVVEILVSFYPDADVIIGGMSASEKDGTVRGFQAGEGWGILIATIQAAGIGITLTRASNVLVVDPTWVDSQNEQAEDRVYRFGQDKRVVITYLVANNKLDQRVFKTLAYKRRAAELSYKNTTRRARNPAAELKKEAVAVSRVITARKLSPNTSKKGYRPALTTQERWAETNISHYLDVKPWILSLTDKSHFQELKTLLDANGGLTTKLWGFLIERLTRYRKPPYQEPEELDDVESDYYRTRKEHL